MRHLAFSLSVIILFLFSIQAVWGTRIETSQKWGKYIQRSIVPSPPVLYIEGNILTVEFIDPLSLVTVSITDANRQVVHVECISNAEDNQHIIHLDIQSGAYKVVVFHPDYGEIEGFFTI